MNAVSPTGHLEQRRLLEKLFLKNKLPHSLLFSGPPGVGKKLVAYELSNAFFCEKNLSSAADYKACRRCRACLLFQSGNIPDFKLINCTDRDKVSAENIRALLYSLNLKAFFSGKRIVIFDNAENLPVQSANILLKSLEEPRSDTFFILVAANPYRLPQTLLSRCQILHFNTLTKKDTEYIFESNPDLSAGLEKLKSAGLPPSELALYTSGSLENLNELIENYDICFKISEGLGLASGGDITAAMDLADILGKDKEMLRIYLRFTSSFISNMMKNAGSNPEYERLACALTSFCIAEKLIFERNLSASYLLHFILVNLACGNTIDPFSHSDENITLLSAA